MSGNVPTSRKLEYAQGWLELGRLNEAADELESIEGKDRMSTPVLLVRCELYMAAKQWDMVDAMAKVITVRELITARRARRCISTWVATNLYLGIRLRRDGVSGLRARWTRTLSRRRWTIRI